jgi:hypothetical protein
MKYYLATNEVDVFHYGEMEDTCEFTTGQPVSFIYNTKEELVAALTGYGQEYQEPQVIDFMNTGDPIINLPDGELPLAEPDGIL